MIYALAVLLILICIALLIFIPAIIIKKKADEAATVVFERSNKFHSDSEVKGQ